MRNKFKEKLLLYKIKAKHDPEAFGEIYDEYAEKIYRFIFFKVASEQEAEDLSSEVFLKAWNYLIGEKPVKSIGALLYTIARNRVIDYYRQKKFEIEATEEMAKQLPEDTSVAELEKKADLARVYKALGKLKDEYREIVVMRYLDDLSIAEIASIIQKTRNNVRVLLHRSVSALKDILEEEENKYCSYGAQQFNKTIEES